MSDISKALKVAFQSGNAQQVSFLNPWHFIERGSSLEESLEERLTPAILNYYEVDTLAGEPFYWRVEPRPIFEAGQIDDEFTTYSLSVRDLPMVIRGAEGLLPYELAHDMTGDEKMFSLEQWLTPQERELLRDNPDLYDKMFEDYTTLERYKFITTAEGVPYAGTDQEVVNPFYYPSYQLNEPLLAAFLDALFYGGLNPIYTYQVSITTTIVYYGVEPDQLLQGLPELQETRTISLSKSFRIDISERTTAISIQEYKTYMMMRIEQLMRDSFRSNVDIRISNVRTDFYIHALQRVQGGVLWRLSPRLNSALYNPATDCVMSCIRSAFPLLNIPARDTIIGELKLNSRGDIPLMKIPALAELLDITLNVLSFVYDAERAEADEYPWVLRQTVLNVGGSKGTGTVIIHSSHMYHVHGELPKNIEIGEFWPEQAKVREKKKAEDTWGQEFSCRKFNGEQDAGKPKNVTQNYIDAHFKPMERYERIYLYDCETFPDGEEEEHTAYSVQYVRMSHIYSKGGYPLGKTATTCKLDSPGFDLNPAAKIKSSTRVIWGTGCFDTFVQEIDLLIAGIVREVDQAMETKDILMQINATSRDGEDKREKKLTEKQLKAVRMRMLQERSLTFVAHNAGRYDMFIMLNETTNFAKRITNTIKANGAYVMVEIDHCVRFIDFVKFLPASLAKICDTMAIPSEYSKGSMPYDFVRRNTLDYVGEIPEPKFWPGGNKIDAADQPRIRKFWEECGISPLTLTAPSQYPWSVKEHVSSYGKLDVIALGIAIHRYCVGMYKTTMSELTNRGFFPLDCVSLPQLAGKFGMRDINVHSERSVASEASGTTRRGDGVAVLREKNQQIFVVKRLCRRQVHP